MRVLVVEDQALVRGAIGSLLALNEGVEVAGLAANGSEALSIMANTTVDVVLTDIEMPETTGLELAAEINQRYPGVYVVIMTTFSKSGYIKRALDLGVSAFILKEQPTDYLVAALNKVVQGGRVIEPELALMALQDNNPLTDKECHALRLAADGNTTKQIAGLLCLSEGTVRNYLSEAISKLHATNRIDAARIARQKGWL